MISLFFKWNTIYKYAQFSKFHFWIWIIETIREDKIILSGFFIAIFHWYSCSRTELVVNKFYFARISWLDKPDGRGLSSSEKCKLHMKTLESLLVLCETKKSHLLLLSVRVLTLFHKLLQYDGWKCSFVIIIFFLQLNLTYIPYIVTL